MRREPILPLMPRATPLKTVDDYFALDDDGRTELLDGVFVVSPSPSYGHQRAVLRLAVALDRQVEGPGLGEVLFAPLDVVLRPTTVAHPDVLFVSTAHLHRIDRHLEGPPDLAVEFLAPSNPENDLDRKMKLYLESGVPQYWIGNLETRTIRVLENAGDHWIEIGTFAPGSVIRPAGMPGVIVEVSEVYEVGAP